MYASYSTFPRSRPRAPEVFFFSEGSTPIGKDPLDSSFGVIYPANLIEYPVAQAAQHFEYTSMSKMIEL